MDSENTKPVSQSRNPSQMTHMDVDFLTRFVTETGKILPRRITGLNSKQQRHITKAIKRARSMLLMK